MRRFRYLIFAGLIAASGGALAQADKLPALGQLLPGSWTLHEIGSRAADRTVCVRDPALLLQLHHGGASCARFVVSSEPRGATVHYTCPGQGHGRTTLKVENQKLVRIQTQGLANGSPFDVDYEARYGGTCTASARN